MKEKEMKKGQKHHQSVSISDHDVENGSTRTGKQEDRKMRDETHILEKR